MLIIVMGCLFAFGCGKARVVEKLQVAGVDEESLYSGYVSWVKDGGFVKSGKWIYRYKNGTKSRSGSYSNGFIHGEWISWHDNGQCASLGNYYRGKPVGCWRFWDQMGNLIERQYFTPESKGQHVVAGMM